MLDFLARIRYDGIRHKKSAPVVELADTPVLGAGGRPWGFKSLRAHQQAGEHSLCCSGLSFKPCFVLAVRIKRCLDKRCIHQREPRIHGIEKPVRRYSNGFAGDPAENRTRVTAVKGRCLNRLTTGPKKTGNDLLSRAVARQVSSARQSLTSVFGMGTGVASAL